MTNRHERRARAAEERRAGRQRASTPGRKAIAELPGVAGVPRLLSFVQGEEASVRLNVAAPQFSTFFTVLDRAYDAAQAAMIPRETDLLILQWFLFCHCSLLRAASMIARGAPDDAAGLSRRALEAAKAAFAVCHDPANAAAWMAYEKRLARWKARESGDKPPPVSLRLKLPKHHKRLDDVGRWIGILSDSGTHFTPEALDHFAFRRKGDKALLSFFVTDRDALDRAMRTCAAVHVLVLHLFNEALKGAFQRSLPWCNAMMAIEQAGARFGSCPGK